MITRIFICVAGNLVFKGGFIYIHGATTENNDFLLIHIYSLIAQLLLNLGDISILSNQSAVRRLLVNRAHLIFTSVMLHTSLCKISHDHQR